MSELLTVPTFLPNKGIVLDKPEEFLSNNYATGQSRNMEFYNELLQSRLGCVKFDTSVLSGPILKTDTYSKLDGTWVFMICTTKDIYSYDFGASRYTILTPTYTTGTITIAGGSPTVVTGSGTTWATNLKAGDYIKIGSGSIHTGSTWYQIASVTNNAQVILTTSAATCSGSAYVARKTFGGGNSNFWNSVTFTDATLGKVWIATNGVDKPVRWTGSGQVQALANLPTGFASAKFVDVFIDRLMFAWTVEGGQNQPQRERWSDVGNCESYQNIDFHDFMEDDLWINGICTLVNYHIVFRSSPQKKSGRQGDAFIGRFVGGDYIFQYDRSTDCAGCWAPQSIAIANGKIYYYGPDSRFHKWDLVNDEIISENQTPFMASLNPILETTIYGGVVESHNQIRWFIPYSSSSYHSHIFVYDFRQSLGQIWDTPMTQSYCSMGSYLNVSDLYVDDTVWGDYYVDEQDGFWDDVKFLSNSPQVVYGGYDGILRKADQSSLDDGLSYTRIFESTRNNYGRPNQKKRLWKQEYWLLSQTSGDVTVKINKNDGNAFDSDSQAVSMIDTTRDIIKKSVTWNKNAENFKTRLESTSHFSMLGFISYLFPKGKTVR